MTRGALIVALLAAGCGTPKVGPPLRPVATRREPVPAPPIERPDCVAWDGSRAGPPVTPGDADRAQAEQLAVVAADAYKQLGKPGLDFAVRVALAEDATLRAIDSLKRDPYNVRATVVLAGMYRLLNRPTCVDNLRRRLVGLPGATEVVRELGPDLLEVPDR